MYALYRPIVPYTVVKNYAQQAHLILRHQPLSVASHSPATVYCLSLTSHCLLPLTHQPLSVASHSPATVYCLSLTSHCLLPLTHQPLSIAPHSPATVYCLSLRVLTLYRFVVVVFTTRGNTEGTNSLKICV